MSSPEPREQVLRALYEAELGNLEQPSTEGLGARARRLLEGVWSQRGQLDRELGAVSVNWRVERMPAVDRNILRLGLYELHHRPETPIAVVISEAVVLAKRYSTPKSGAFVNGVLARLADTVVERTEAPVEG